VSDAEDFKKKFYSLSYEDRAREWEWMPPEQQQAIRKDLSERGLDGVIPSTSTWSGGGIAILVTVAALVLAVAYLGRSANSSGDPSRASESTYNRDIRLARTSEGLSNADIAWHATNTYGWDCEQVVTRLPAESGYFVVVCSNNTRLRVYPRVGQHPRITNEHGTYK
jgi:hypothetical protein